MAMDGVDCAILGAAMHLQPGRHSPGHATGKASRVPHAA